MVKKGNFLIGIIFLTIILFFPMIMSENIIYGDPLSPEESLNSIKIASDDFFYNELGYVKISAFNSNNSLIDVDTITIIPLDLREYYDYSVTTSLSQDLNQIYKKGFMITNENITSVTFNIVVKKGDKTITQEYTINLGDNTEKTTAKDKWIASLNFLYDGFITNWVIFLIVFLIVFMIVFIIKGVNYLTK